MCSQLPVAVSDDTQSTRAWAVGAVGEKVLAKSLDALTNRGVRVLHDRRISRTKANIDHSAIGPSGVFVIDAKRYRGRPSLRIQAGVLRPRRETRCWSGPGTAPNGLVALGEQVITRQQVFL